MRPGLCYHDPRFAMEACSKALVAFRYCRPSARWRSPLLLLITMVAGCFYPPQTKPPTPDHSSSVTLSLPYDLAWNAVQAVVEKNEFKVVLANPNDGTLEAQAVGGGFTLQDADCGKVRGVGRTIDAEPDPNSSAVYDFHVQPKGQEASTVSIEATFTAPLHVPLHPVTDIQCTSRGRQEARLLDEIKKEAPKQRRPIEHAAPDILKNPS